LRPSDSIFDDNEVSWLPGTSTGFKEQMKELWGI
jgi:hypothetical protein